MEMLDVSVELRLALALGPECSEDGVAKLEKTDDVLFELAVESDASDLVENIELVIVLDLEPVALVPEPELFEILMIPEAVELRPRVCDILLDDREISEILEFFEDTGVMLAIPNSTMLVVITDALVFAAATPIASVDDDVVFRELKELVMLD